jgi:polyisoprenyl-teichoic acid--peptidoglycan teichoic acid transferase
MLRARKAPHGRVTARAARRFLGGGLLVALLTTIAVSVGVIEGIDTIADAFSSGQLIQSSDLTPAKVGAAQTIMIVGSDKRSLSRDSNDRTSPPHTDTILLVRLDPNAGAISVLSVPRDLLVPKFTFRGHTYFNNKINAAYSIGAVYGSKAADKLALDVVKKALGNITINDFIDLNFASFETVVAKLGCVYVDVDRAYFHRNYAGEPSDQNYEAINIRPGYKSLCGNTALAYVRYRHDDNTFARDARQQDFLRQAKNQLGVTGLLSHGTDILNAIAKSVTTNIHDATSVARLVNLALFTLDNPVRQIQFPDNPVNIGGGDYQTATKREIRKVVAQFENSSKQAAELPGSSTQPASSGGGSGSSGHHHVHHAHRAPAVPGLIPTPSSMRAAALQLAPELPFKVELPMKSSAWAAQTGQQYDYYAYELRDLQGHKHWSYHITWADTKAAGAYYGIEGTTWTDPPLFHGADTRYYGGRAYAEVGNGHHIQDIGWVDHGVLYWINNTLFDDLTNAQMVAMARSARPIF